jgi:hypothetical protein
MNISKFKQGFFYLIPLIIGIFLFYMFGNESRSGWKITSGLCILFGWYFFYDFLFNKKLRKSFSGKSIFIFSAFSSFGLFFLMDYYFYSYDVDNIQLYLREKAPVVITVVKEEEHQKKFYFRHNTVPEAWVYRYDILVEGKKYNGATSFDQKIFSKGDSIKVAYFEENPKINRILINRE